jgi:hypothetical protein
MTITEALAAIDREFWDTPPEVNEAIRTVREALAPQLREEQASSIAAELAREDL